MFDVTLEQGVNITLKVTDGSQLTNTVIREASASQNGLMPAAAFAQVNSNTQAIESLQNAGLYRGSFTTLQDAPTTTPDSAFIGGEIYQNDFITVQQASEGGQTGIARYRAAVNNGAVSYAFETFIDKDIPNFSAGNAGLIVGSTTDGEVEATQSGTGAVKGWSTVKNDIAANAQNITTNANAISALDGRLTTAEGNITSLGGRVTTNENAITALDGRVTAVESTTTSQGADITALKNKSVQATTDTTLSANSEKLLTVKGMLRQWVDITQDGLPVDPDPDTLYYTVES